MITIRDEHLENQIDRERKRRGDATLSKTMSTLVRERLMQLDLERRDRLRPVAAGKHNDTD